MRNYEIAYIADSDLDDSSLAELEEKVKGWVEANGGKVSDVDRWGKRWLAYPIQKKNDGFYFFVKAEMPANAPVEVERNLRLNEQILRFMVTVQETA
ncbi:MAG: 30S ribosomal protein S6 [Anaerolineales bacterium]|jgi:small subunit ribosomal protein S6